MGSRTAWIAAIALVALGCAQRSSVVRAPDARADRLRAALVALSSQKGYRAVRRVVRDGREFFTRDLFIAPDYVHSTGDEGEVYARGTRVVRRSSSGKGWLREEVPARAAGIRADIEALLRWAGHDARFAEPRSDDGCEVVEFAVDGETLRRVVQKRGGVAEHATRVVVVAWIGPDGLPRRTLQRSEGASPVEIDCRFSDFGVDSDPDIPGPVRRLLDLP